MTNEKQILIDDIKKLFISIKKQEEINNKKLIGLLFKFSHKELKDLKSELSLDLWQLEQDNKEEEKNEK